LYEPRTTVPCVVYTVDYDTVYSVNQTEKVWEEN
jgi:hypothetical protein